MNIPVLAASLCLLGFIAQAVMTVVYFRLCSKIVRFTRQLRATQVQAHAEDVVAAVVAEYQLQGIEFNVHSAQEFLQREIEVAKSAQITASHVIVIVLGVQTVIAIFNLCFGALDVAIMHGILGLGLFFGVVIRFCFYAAFKAEKQHW